MKPRKLDFILSMFLSDVSVIFGKKVNAVPGVGEYNIDVGKKGEINFELNGFSAIDRRFKPGQNCYKNCYTPPELGPGSYDLSREFGKKSFNVMFINNSANGYRCKSRK